ncbi:hypothetical protein Tco_0769298 [Tanacetum coccineum]|uniref:Xylulose kinase-1 n=1 Tax=Tanacetum coccineum TaxID=301880 RepID=A0ABQ4ZBY0_9ASTR
MAHMGFCDKHNMVAFLQKPARSEEFHQIVDFHAGSHIRYALTTNPTIYVSLVEQFWHTTTVETINDGEQQITVTVDEHNFAITEASLVDRVTSLETELTKTKQLYGKAITKLVKKGRTEESEVEGVQEKRQEVEYHFDQTLLQQEITPLKAQSVQDQSTSSFEADLSLLSAAKILVEASIEKIKTYMKRRRSTDSSKVGTTEGTTKGIFSTAEDIQGIDEEVARKVQEEEQAKAMEQQEQERLNLEAAKELQIQLDQRQETDDID